MKGVPDWLVIGGSYVAPMLSLIFGALAVCVTIFIYLWSGSRVKVETYFAISTSTGNLKFEDASVMSIPITFLDRSSGPVCCIRARNVGRLPIDIESVGFKSQRGLTLPRVPGTGIGPGLPVTLNPGQSKNWMFSIHEMKDLTTYVTEEIEGEPKSVRAHISLANDKDLYSDWITFEQIDIEIERWAQIQKNSLK